MSFPQEPAAADPTDPMSQTSWPSGRRPSKPQASDPPDAEPLTFEGVRPPTRPKLNGADACSSQPEDAPRIHLTKRALFNLSVGMAGAQVAWTVELGYGTPFLLSLGLSEQLTSLVWLAGPISGLIAQPLIGAISDSSTSRYRRRFWIAWSTVVLVGSCLCLAYAEEISTILVDFFGAGVGDWDPKRYQVARKTAIGIAITAFYLLDFALNALQASLRNLLLDIVPPEQVSAGNAWHGRMTHAGNIIGFGFGYLNLADWPVLRGLGGSQFRKFCIVGIIILVVTVWITCWTQEEHPPEGHVQRRSELREALGNIFDAISNLPSPIRKVCLVQVFAFMAWFPFLFYATTYIGQVMARQNNKDPDVDVATRAGNFALLMYSIVAVIAGSLLPELTHRDERLLWKDDDDDDESNTEIMNNMIMTWQLEANARGETLKLPRKPLTLRDMWSFALFFYGAVSICTFFINTVAQATVAIALIGICWAVAVWAPFAMIMEFLKEVDENPMGDIWSSSGSSGPPSERTALLIRVANTEVPASDELASSRPVAGGTVLGIHNLAIVFPQFIVALVSSLIFRIVDEAPAIIGEPTNIYLGKNGVAWVLRFGGLSAFVGALLARLVPLTLQERRMRTRLAGLRLARKALRV